MLLLLLACSSESPVSAGSPAPVPLIGDVLVDLTEVHRWEAHPGAGTAQCAFGPEGWSVRQMPGASGPAYCWLGLREPLEVPEGTDVLAIRAGWTGAPPEAEARVQAELEGASTDAWADWPVSAESDGGSHLFTADESFTVAVRMAMGCPGCDLPDGFRVERLEVVALGR
ncbi:MAG: hypothetical protein H6737_09120 [Alphaproteobacteria bacterium]|nr:hypothetical protein [Alphaproteobacteria bacterium]